MIVAGMANTLSIKYLILAGCSIRPAAVHILASQLCEKDTQMKELDLSFNYVGAVGCMSIATVIEVNRTITSINLR